MTVRQTTNIWTKLTHEYIYMNIYTYIWTHRDSCVHTSETAGIISGLYEEDVRIVHAVW